MSIVSSIKAIQDIMRKDDGVDGDAQRIGQLTWMLFLKVFDQREEEWEDSFEGRGETYVSPLPEACRWRNWAKYTTDSDGKSAPQIAASDLIAHVNETVFPGLRELPLDTIDDDDSRAKAKVVREVFVDSNNYMKSGPLMLGVIEKLDEAINFHDFKTRSNLGDVYEKILNDLRSAGNAGEFYTPRAVTHFMVQMVNPILKKRETVLDPACGTGGFLTATIDHFNSQITKKSSAEDKKAIESCIHGIEKKQLPHLLCTTNMMLHGIDVPSQIEHKNTLAKAWNDWSRNEKVDCVITNPPFGGSEEDGVGTDFPADLRTRETSDMFLTLIVKKLLKDGGRGAIVLPDGNLFGEGVKAKVKQLLLEECNLHTIIRLPNGVFAPYTGIKTNLLFFTKGKSTDTIWYYEHPYPTGYKSYSKTKPITLDEFQAEKEWWGNESNGFADRVESERAWKVDFKSRKRDAEAKAKPHWDKAEALNNQAAELERQARETNGNTKQDLKEQADKLRQKAKDEQSAGDRIFWPIYNLDAKNPNSPEAESHDPDALLVKFKEISRQIADTEEQLKQALAAAFAHHVEGNGHE
ncbi:MAG: type I restriction-modification system subunit M [Proteobacteria bacterium]|nr:type I restriction-modification system subunit M [Pseudomonadota bacterium]